MQDHQDDSFAARRAELEAQFQALSPTRRDDYWRRIEEPAADRRLPLEALAMCARERLGAGAAEDAKRIFEVIVERIGTYVGRWASSRARQAKSGMRELQEDLEQECYLRLWQELAASRKTFLTEQFFHTLGYIFQHTEQQALEQAGVRQRKGVATPTRVPADAVESLQAETARGGHDPVAPLSEQIADTRTQDAFDLAEYSDLFERIKKLPADLRTILYDRFYHERPQQETAAELGISDRTVRTRLKALLDDLRRSYQGGEGEDHV